MKIICNYSCGVASAVATMLALREFEGQTFLILNAYVREEHPDNFRFLKDCERWFGHPITRVMNHKYEGSVHDLIRKKKYIKSRFGAPCSSNLKREILRSVCNPGDVNIIGYTLEEEERLNRLIDANNELEFRAPLIDARLTKSDCFEIVKRAGIELPEMNRLGYEHANCIGCVKGGKGYWNRIRVDFPGVFEQMAVLEETIGVAAYLFYNPKTKTRISLRQLDPNSGRFKEDQPGSCGYFCELAEEKIDARN